jgi:hypothetical protein
MLFRTVILLARLPPLDLDGFFGTAPLAVPFVVAGGVDPVAGRHTTTYTIWRTLKGMRYFKSEETGLATMEEKLRK